ncbi:MAG: tetratricopeptide repeat protein [Rhodospirillales bacterium]|nr:tetratricopeptide repeat protein [Rhodospirillales bacterium]
MTMPPLSADAGFYQEILARDPGCAAVRAAFAASLLAAGEAEAAIAAADEALDTDPSLASAWLTRAAAQTRLHRHEAAAAALERADALVPNRAEILLAWGAAFAALDRLAEAEACLQRAALCGPDNAAVAASLGSVLLRRGRFDAAEVECRRALALAPGLCVAHQNLAGLLARSRPEEARFHRDAAYRDQQVFVEPGGRAERVVLVPSVADTGNIPLRHLFPPARTTIIRWYVEYATPDQDRALPDHDLVFNAIGDPDRLPKLPPSAARLFATSARPLLNPPDRVARTGRAHLPGLLAGLPDVLVPDVVRADLGTAPASLLPALVRPIGAHGGEGIHRVATAAALSAALSETGPAYVTRFVDGRGPDGWYRKYRTIFIDREPYPYHLAIGRHWLVHYWTAGMAGDAGRQAEEARFLADPAAALGGAGMAALRAIGARLDLDFAGIDYGVLPDGRLLVFEANATMLVHPEDDPEFAYRNPAVTRILEAFDAMLVRRMGVARP